MDITTVDLYGPQFWIFYGIALALLTPIRSAAARRWLFALLNVAFLVQLLKLHVVEALVGVLVVCLLLRMATGPARRAVLATLALLVLLVFLVHKLPALQDRAELAISQKLLVAIGFSYVALRILDVARAVGDARQRPPDVASAVNYLLPFHMLVAGPIQAYDDFVLQPAVPPAPGFEQSLAAIERIALGLFKKFIVAGFIEKMFLTGFRADGPYFFLEMQMNYIWLYLDFSAYTDIAVGVGSLLGVATPENFNRPYLARNIIEFWDRWHMSLSQWIRRNLFFPTQLAFMRATDGRFPLAAASVAFLIAFLLCGLWHNIGWTWLAWGGVQAVGPIACNIYKARLSKRLGRNGVKQYLANPWIKWFSVFLTNEFFAASLVIVAYPFEEMYR